MWNVALFQMNFVCIRTLWRDDGRELNAIIFFYSPIYAPSRSLTPAKVITREATNKSAIASDAKNRFPMRRKLRSVYMARHTNILPAIDKNIKRDKKMPAEKSQFISLLHCHRCHNSLHNRYIIHAFMVHAIDKWYGRIRLKNMLCYRTSRDIDTITDISLLKKCIKSKHFDMDIRSVERWK